MAIQTFTAVQVAQFLIKNDINATAEFEATMEVECELISEHDDRYREMMEAEAD